MKKLLYVVSLIFCIVEIDKIKAMEQGASLRYDDLNRSHDNTANRLQNALGGKIPDGLKTRLEDLTHVSLEPVYIQKSSSEFSPSGTVTQEKSVKIGDFNDGAKLFVDKTAGRPQIIFQETKNFSHEITPRSNNQNFDNGYTIATKYEGNITEVRHFDAAGKETLMSHLNNSDIAQSLKSIGKDIADFFTAHISQFQTIGAMPKGEAKDQAEQNLVTEVVDQAVDQNVSFTVKQQLWQDTYNQAKELFSTGKFNSNTLRAWIAYPYDRMMEYRLSSKKSTVTISRNPVTGFVTIETVGGNKVNQQIFENGQLSKEINYTNDKLVDSTTIFYNELGKKVLTTQLLYDKNQRVEYVRHTRFDENTGLLQRMDTLDPQGNAASPSLDQIKQMKDQAKNFYSSLPLTH